VRRRAFLETASAGVVCTLAGCPDEGSTTAATAGPSASPTSAPLAEPPSFEWTEELTGEDSYAVSVTVTFNDAETVRFDLAEDGSTLATVSADGESTLTRQLAGFDTAIGVVGGDATIVATVLDPVEERVARYQVGATV
jgi:hypothetical protein